MRRPRLLVLPALLLATLSLAACGEDGSGGDTASDQTPPASTTTTPTATATPAPAPTTEPTPAAPSTSAAPTRTPAPSTSSTPAEPVTDPALREAAQAYADAFLTGDAPAAFDLLSERCKDGVDMAAFGEDAIAAGKKYRSPQAIAVYDAQVAGDSATLAYQFAGNAPARRGEPWVREQGFWHLDEC